MTVSTPSTSPDPSARRQAWDERVAELHHEPVDLSAPRWDRPYPKVPAGWTLGPPDFIGIGAQKAGTSWWYGLLRAHPDVADTELKETHHLITLGWRPMSERDVLSYHRYFPRPVGALVGEWTPRYMPTPGVVDTMRACAPEAKLLAILRNPVERYRSGVAEWIRGKDRRGRPGRLASGREDALVRSFYGFPLERFIQAFGRQRVLIQQFEKCQADPGGEYRRMLRFLELPDWEPSQDELSTPVNVAATTASADDLAEPDDLAGWFEDDVRLLKDLAPDFELSLWPQFSHLA